MKKRYLAPVMISAFVLGAAGVAVATTIGPPEIDAANASIQVKPIKFTPTRCLGVHGVPYVTYRGSWDGGETDLSHTTPYNLTGNLSVTGIVWTINLKTDRGLLHGKATLTSQPAAGGPSTTTYSGPLTLVTQGTPDTPASAPGFEARGWIDAPTYTGGSLDGGTLVANVEFNINAGFAANGEFGSTMSYPDLSVWTNNKVC
jgi:hypothetical protein